MDKVNDKESEITFVEIIDFLWPKPILYNLMCAEYCSSIKCQHSSMMCLIVIKPSSLIHGAQ